MRYKWEIPGMGDGIEHHRYIVPQTCSFIPNCTMSGWDEKLGCYAIETPKMMSSCRRFWWVSMGRLTSKPTRSGEIGKNISHIDISSSQDQFI